MMKKKKVQGRSNDKPEEVRSLSILGEAAVVVAKMRSAS